MHVLLVEYDLTLGEHLRARLRQDDYAVNWVQGRKAAELTIEAKAYALLILDLGLLRKTGIDVLVSLRRKLGAQVIRNVRGVRYMVAKQT